MAIDFDKIKQKVEQLSGNNRKTVLWSPKPGNNGASKEYNIRILPWTDGNDGQPFKERAFYYNIGGGRAILAPSQFGLPDPIQDLINKLRKSGTPAEMELCKQFYPKRRYYAPIIVRGEEDQGVKLWSFGKQIANELLQAMLGDFGDITDPKDGRDVKITCTQPAGRQFVDTKVQPRVATSPLGPAKQVKDWLAAVPNLDEIYSHSTAEEIEKRVNDHLNGGSSPNGTEKPTQNGRPRTAEVSSEESGEMDDVFSKLDNIVEDDN